MGAGVHPSALHARAKSFQPAFNLSNRQHFSPAAAAAAAALTPNPTLFSPSVLPPARPRACDLQRARARGAQTKPQASPLFGEFHAFGPLIDSHHPCRRPGPRIHCASRNHPNLFRRHTALASSFFLGTRRRRRVACSLPLFPRCPPPFASPSLAGKSKPIRRLQLFVGCAATHPSMLLAADQWMRLPLNAPFRSRGARTRNRVQ